MKNTHLRNFYIKTIANIETSMGLVGKYDAADLISLAKEGELLALADVLYYINLAEEGCETVFKNLKEEKKEQIRNYHTVKGLKVKYIENEHFLTGDEYLVLSEVAADEKERRKLLFNAAKYYLQDFREYDNAFSGAMFLKTFSRSAEREGLVDFSKTELAKDVKNTFLWGSDAKKQALFINLIKDVRKGIVRASRKKEVINKPDSLFARAYAIDFYKNRNNKARNKIMIDLSV